MIAAIYARKSTEQNGVADEAKSITRQVEHARAYAKKKGWIVADEFLFVDDGVSGAEFTNRPGYMRLLNALKPRALFQVLIVSELSRLGREQFETGYAVKQLSQAGVTIFSYLENREILLDTPTDKFLMSAVNFAAEIEREKARQRVNDTMMRKARAGHVCGGEPFGYQNVKITGPDGRHSHVERKINSEEAAVVVRIFELCRDGKGTRRICQILNAEHAPAPRAQQRRPNGWVPSSVRAVLYRDLYRGQQTWGRARKRNTWGQIAVSRRPETEWIRTSVPSLRLVSDELWEAAHERLGASRLNYLRATDGKLWGKPANGIESKYLLTGMATCGACGGGMLVYSRKSPRQRAFFYGCPRARVDLCRNNLEVPMETADAAALEIIADDVLSPDVIELAIEKLMAMFDAPAENINDRRGRIADGLRKVEKELAHLQVAVAAGEPPETLLTGIRERERRQNDWRAELRSLDAGPTVRAAAGQIRHEALQLLDDWRGLLGKHVATSRQLLRKVLDRERFVFYPQSMGAERWYDLGVMPTLDRFFAAVPLLKKAVASPPGFTTDGNTIPSNSFPTDARPVNVQDRSSRGVNTIRCSPSSFATICRLTGAWRRSSARQSFTRARRSRSIRATSMCETWTSPVRPSSCWPNAAR